jgi:murein L,D-transpeptidase YafK
MLLKKVVRIIMKRILTLGVFLFVTAFLYSAQKPSTEKPLPKIDLILVEKSSRIMSIFHKGTKIKTYKIALGFDPIGHKEQEGDGKTPEGVYFVSHKYPNSQFYLALQVSYPSQKNAKKKGVSAGGQIMIHGLGKTFSWLGKLHVNRDWTLGCIAVTNEEIKEIYDATVTGTKIEIRS